MDQMPAEYRGNRCVALLRRPDGSNWAYYVRVGDSIKAIERDMEERRRTYGFSYIRPPDDDIPEEKDKFLAVFEMVNVDFLDLAIAKVRELNLSRAAKTSPLDIVTLDDILAMQKHPAEKEKDDSPVLEI